MANVDVDGGEHRHDHEQPQPQQDILRDTPLRLLGYFNEGGEAFKAFISRRLYVGTYIVASTYCATDAISKGAAVYNDFEAPGNIAKTVEKVAETSVWQGLASVIIPGFTINRVVFFTTKLMKNAPARPRAIVPTAVGLITIPLIVTPIDRMIDEFISHAYKPAVAWVFPNLALSPSSSPQQTQPPSLASSATTNTTALPTTILHSNSKGEG
eukprot:m.158003 g.158003  ORF g.158003 m.158003 type:complete len:212 (+) comp31071_c0_seq2:160-795(+)